MRPIEEIIELVGVSAIAAAFNPPISVQAVYKWPLQDRLLADRCPILERLARNAGGSQTCEQLRPDLCWIRIPDAEWPHPEGRPLPDYTQASSA